MIKSLCASTYEIDDPSLAVSEILEALDIGSEGVLLKNTVGILHCYAEFVESGVVAALAEALPFEILGTTTSALAACGESSEFLLNLTVFTSDDVSFVTGMSEPVTHEDPRFVYDAYKRAVAGREESPSLILSFFPLTSNGDFYGEALNEASGGAPIFGNAAMDHTENFELNRTISSSGAYIDRFVFCLLYGQVDPRFYVSNLIEEKVFDESGLVTSSQGNLLMEVNNMPVIDWLESLGLERNEYGAIYGFHSLAFIMEYENGDQVIRAMLNFDTENNCLVCAGKVPVGVKLTLSAISKDGVIRTAKDMLERLVQERLPGESTVFMVSCAGRYFALDMETEAELKLTVKSFEGTGMNYMLVYSGGEFCPLTNEKTGQLSNRSFNNAFVALVM